MERCNSLLSKQDEIFASLILRYIPRLGPRSWKKLYEAFDSPVRALEEARYWSDLGISRKSIQGTKNREIEEKAKQEYNRAISLEIEMLSLWNKDYPFLLREIIDPPVLLYLKGNLGLLSSPRIAVVGTRTAGAWGKEFSFSLGKGLSNKGVCVVSGLARGIDTSAHKGALRGKASTIAVLGTGIMVEYPYENRELKRKIKEEGLLITEFSPFTPPSPENFPLRNRIISGLSLGVVVVEAARKSGSLITAQRALEQNRLVFAVPGSPANKRMEGNNILLRQGAILIRNEEDVIEEIFPMIEGGLFPDVEVPSYKAKESFSNLHSISSDLEGKILNLLHHKGMCKIEEIIETLGCEASVVLSSLVMMEINGEIRKTDQGYEVL